MVQVSVAVDIQSNHSTFVAEIPLFNRHLDCWRVVETYRQQEMKGRSMRGCQVENIETLVCVSMETSHVETGIVANKSLEANLLDKNLCGASYSRRADRP